MVEKNTNKILALITLAIICVVAIILGVNANINIKTDENGVNAEIQFSDQQIPAVIESGQGEVIETTEYEGEEIKTVESVDATGPQVNPEDEAPVECPEGEECGRGAAYPYVDTSTPEAFVNATLGGCYNIDGYYDEQCWDYAALFFLNYAGHTFYTCGTGAAKGAIADGCWQLNAGDKFDMVWDPTILQPGDIAVFDNGVYGHVGDVVGYYNNGYIALAGQNQGGGLCPGSTMGARVNIINISLKHFAGAFRPKTYVKPDPQPEPEPEPVVDQCKVWNVQKGDTMGKIMKACRGEIKWGEAMNEYASHWYSIKYQRTLTVYAGWTTYPGVGLFAGDTIEYRD